MSLQDCAYRLHSKVGEYREEFRVEINGGICENRPVAMLKRRLRLRARVLGVPPQKLGSGHVVGSRYISITDDRLLSYQRSPASHTKLPCSIAMDDDHETYILLLLSDSNLPIGSFVASSGLESYVKHGFAPSDSNPIDFIRDSLQSYSRSALPFVSDAHRMVEKYKIVTGSNNGDDTTAGGIIEQTLGSLTELDMLYDAMTLNHVARRASKAQGVALLTLYSKGFSRPSYLSDFSNPEARDPEAALSKLLDRFKLMVRREEVYGHLPTCWGILTAALGLSLGVCKDRSLIDWGRDINGFSQNGLNTFIFSYMHEVFFQLRFV